MALNAAMCGLYAIAASCNAVQNFDACIIGIVSAVLFNLGDKLLIRLKIDDPCYSTLSHGVSGFWGVFALGLFDSKEGLIYSGNPHLLQIQMIGGVALLAWSMSLSFCFFYTMHSLKRLRVPLAFEIISVDFLYHSTLQEIENAQKFQKIIVEKIKDSTETAQSVYNNLTPDFNT